MADDPNLSPPRPNRFTQFLKRAGESTTAFYRRAKPTGGSSIMVGGFIGASATASEIIELGISGQHVGMWHAAKFLFYFTLAACYAHNLWKSDPNARPSK